ncbi:aspartate/glutamate racemase family protein [Variovorax sp. UMC13]|uniref:aspartate/glutamate racemase family protein n=1 Tax=Variovorax sp. UMC13 TaxID=1862326 RepID=UPI001603C71A|nr:amino acid racemase [Variovorax sp. UMC13]MBB1602769.1 glutamate racemase [Variovorax sp. UMC13]
MNAVPQRLGVLGGMGPLAGAAFALRMVQLTPADSDQQHIPVLLCNDPAIPDRSSACMGTGPSPLPAMLRGIDTLVAGGADCIAIPCNTAHLWFDELQAASPTRLLHIVDSVVADLRRQGVTEGKVGILGTPATIAMGLYQRYLRAAGYEPIEPSAEEVQRLCVPAIAAVKANRIDAAFAPAAEGVRLLAQRGAKAVVLGCTELPLAVPPGRRAELGIVLTDSIDALAREAIALMRPGTA